MKRNKVQNTQSIMDKPAHPHVDTHSEMYLYAGVFHRFFIGSFPVEKVCSQLYPRGSEKCMAHGVPSITFF